MSDLDAFYDGFSLAVTDRDPKARPSGFDETATRRFAIYRNNVRRGLGDALAAAYPTVQRLVGEGFFTRLAGEFIATEQSRPGSLALYGGGFSEFLSGHEVSRQLPYLVDIARLERARLEAMNARDADPLGPQDLAGMEDRLESLGFVAHPACHVIVSSHPIHAIWQAQKTKDTDTVAKKQIIQRAEAVLITRPMMDVEIRYLTTGQAAFATALLVDQFDLAVACAHAAEIDDAFDVMRSFADLLIAGAFAAVTMT